MTVANLCSCANQLQPHRRLEGVCPPKWTVPKGDTIEEVIRDAAGQVIRNYGPALRALGLDKRETMTFEDWKHMTFTEDDPSVQHEAVTTDPYNLTSADGGHNER